VLVLVLVLVLERCCLQKRRVNPIRSAKPELHPASAGLEVLNGREISMPLASFVEADTWG